MTRSMRTRYQEPPPPRRPQWDDDDTQGPGGLTRFGNVILCLVIAALGSLAVWWLLSDISGDYSYQSKRTGVVRLTILRHATNMTGRIEYGKGAPLALVRGDLTKGNHLELAFESEDSANPRSATFSGDIENGDINGVLQIRERRYKMKFTRNSICSLYRQIQSHLPFAG